VSAPFSKQLAGLDADVARLRAAAETARTGPDRISAVRLYAEPKQTCRAYEELFADELERSAAASARSRPSAAAARGGCRQLAAPDTRRDPRAMRCA
jgi:hypothetical protein